MVLQVWLANFRTFSNLVYSTLGTGKTLLARACAKDTDAIFLKLAGPQLVQMYIGE
jgi:26S proteasome regulatory subunit T5